MLIVFLFILLEKKIMFKSHVVHGHCYVDNKILLENDLKTFVSFVIQRYSLHISPTVYFNIQIIMFKYQ